MLVFLSGAQYPFVIMCLVLNKIKRDSHAGQYCVVIIVVVDTLFQDTHSNSNLILRLTHLCFLLIALIHYFVSILTVTMTHWELVGKKTFPKFSFSPFVRSVSFDEAETFDFGRLCVSSFYLTVHLIF